MTAEYQTPLGDFDPLDAENHLVDRLEQEKREPGFYPSLEAALTPFIGAEAAQSIAEIETRERNLQSEDLYTPISTTRDRLPTRKDVAQEILGDSANQTETTIQIVRPPQQFVWLPETAHEWRKSKSPELRQLGKLSWDGEQTLYRFELEENGKRKIMFVSDPKVEVRGMRVFRIEKYEKVGDPDKPEFKVTYHPYRLDDVRSEREIDEENPELTGEVEVYNQGHLQVTKIKRQTGDKSTEVVFCGITNKESGETVVINDLVPEFVCIEPNGNKVDHQSVDNPVLYLPDGWPKSEKDLRELGKTFANIEMYYEAFQQGIDPFLKYYYYDQSTVSRMTTSREAILGTLALNVLGVVGTLTPEESTRYTGAAIILGVSSAAAAGALRHGEGYRAIQRQRAERADLFVKKLALRGISFE